MVSKNDFYSAVMFDDYDLDSGYPYENYWEDHLASSQPTSLYQSESDSDDGSSGSGTTLIGLDAIDDGDKFSSSCKSSHDNLADENNISSIERELFNNTHFAGTSLFNPPTVSDADMLTLLRTLGLYDEQRDRWKDVPLSPQNEGSLIEPFRKIIDTLLNHYGLSATRTVISDSSQVGVDFKSAPPLAVCGSGDSFRSLKKNDLLKPGYLSYVTPIDIRLTETLWPLHDLLQAGLFARECFFRQDSRVFVYSLLLTENTALVYRFDRSGAQYSSFFDIHRNPAAFVAVILQLSDLDNFVGFNTRTSWAGDKRYIRVVSTNDPTLDFEIVGHEPISSRAEMVGSGTCCYRVVDVHGNTFIVKDSWGLTSEAKMLAEARGMPGVVQAIGYQNGILVSQLRGVEPDLTVPFFSPYFKNRRFGRNLLTMYDRTLDKFQNKKELLCGLRDAIAGHSNLFKAGILHRNISPSNIMIGMSECTDGNRGILIDLSSAQKVDLDFPLVDHRIGTRTFQSIAVLRSDTARTVIDYLDDLESFFYVLCWICSGFIGPNMQVKERPVNLDSWASDDPQCSECAKLSFIHSPIDENFVTPYFGAPFHRILEDLRMILVPHLDEKLNWMHDFNEDYGSFLFTLDRVIKDSSLQEWLISPDLPYPYYAACAASLHPPGLEMDEDLDIHKSCLFPFGS
ncbi:hypothetical protein B0H34DRAFT_10385 [Crassisporium funariophilum]|nr:hypothetical protein B0H34DRAFT_10385 [Crassisporium funariophilum]